MLVLRGMAPATCLQANRKYKIMITKIKNWFSWYSQFLIRRGMDVSWWLIAGMFLVPIIISFTFYVMWRDGELRNVYGAIGFEIFWLLILVVTPMLLYGKLFGRKRGYEELEAKYQPNPNMGAYIGMAIGASALVKYFFGW
jgi:hypothetical protein